MPHVDCDNTKLNRSFQGPAPCCTPGILRVAVVADFLHGIMQGFEEIHVPALKPKPFAKNERIVKIKELPAWMHPAFEGMDALNRIQSRVRH